MEESQEMEVGKISKLLFKFSLPAIVGLLVNALYNVVDSAFVGRGVGDLALAGITVSLPIMTTFMACVMLIGMGATSLISIRLGERKGEEAEKIVGNALVLFIIIGLVLTVLGLIFLEPILTLFGASPDVLPYSIDYMRIILLGSVFMAIGLGMNNFIRAEGNPKIAMNTMLIGAITNIILDYIFIFNWGIKGAAFATILSYTVTSTWVIYHFIAGNSKLKIRKENLKLNKVIVREISILGFPTFAMQITGSVQHLILNKSLAHYGGDMALAAIGIIMSVSTLLVMPAMGIFFKFLPLIGVQIMSASYFQAVGKPHQATILSLSRQVFIFIPLLLILPKKLGLEGIWLSSPISDIAAFVVTGIWLWVEIKHLSKIESLKEVSVN